MQPLIVIEGRGWEPVEWIPTIGFRAEGVESGTVFDEIDLTDLEWCDYDEKAGESVDIMDIQSEQALIDIAPMVSMSDNPYMSVDIVQTADNEIPSAFDDIFTNITDYKTSNVKDVTKDLIDAAGNIIDEKKFKKNQIQLDKKAHEEMILEQQLDRELDHDLESGEGLTPDMASYVAKYPVSMQKTAIIYSNSANTELASSNKQKKEAANKRAAMRTRKLATKKPETAPVIMTGAVHNSSLTELFEKAKSEYQTGKLKSAEDNLRSLLKSVAAKNGTDKKIATKSRARPKSARPTRNSTFPTTNGFSECDSDQEVTQPGDFELDDIVGPADALEIEQKSTVMTEPTEKNKPLSKKNSFKDKNKRPNSAKSDKSKSQKPAGTQSNSTPSKSPPVELVTEKTDLVVTNVPVVEVTQKEEIPVAEPITIPTVQATPEVQEQSAAEVKSTVSTEKVETSSNQVEAEAPAPQKELALEPVAINDISVPAAEPYNDNTTLAIQETKEVVKETVSSYDDDFFDTPAQPKEIENVAAPAEISKPNDYQDDFSSEPTVVAKPNPEVSRRQDSEYAGKLAEDLVNSIHAEKFVSSIENIAALNPVENQYNEDFEEPLENKTAQYNEDFEEPLEKKAPSKPISRAASVKSLSRVASKSQLRNSDSQSDLVKKIARIALPQSEPASRAPSMHHIPQQNESESTKKAQSSGPNSRPVSRVASSRSIPNLEKASSRPSIGSKPKGNNSKPPSRAASTAQLPPRPSSVKNIPAASQYDDDFEKSVASPAPRVASVKNISSNMSRSTSNQKIAKEDSQTNLVSKAARVGLPDSTLPSRQASNAAIPTEKVQDAMETSAYGDDFESASTPAKSTATASKKSSGPQTPQKTSSQTSLINKVAKVALPSSNAVSRSASTSNMQQNDLAQPNSKTINFFIPIGDSGDQKLSALELEPLEQSVPQESVSQALSHSYSQTDLTTHVTKIPLPESAPESRAASAAYIPPVSEVIADNVDQYNADFEFATVSPPTQPISKEATLKQAVKAALPPSLPASRTASGANIAKAQSKPASRATSFKNIQGESTVSRSASTKNVAANSSKPPSRAVSTKQLPKEVSNAPSRSASSKDITKDKPPSRVASKQNVATKSTTDLNSRVPSDMTLAKNSKLPDSRPMSRAGTKENLSNGKESRLRNEVSRTSVSNDKGTVSASSEDLIKAAQNPLPPSEDISRMSKVGSVSGSQTNLDAQKGAAIPLPESEPATNTHTEKPSIAGSVKGSMQDIHRAKAVGLPESTVESTVSSPPPELNQTPNEPIPASTRDILSKTVSSRQSTSDISKAKAIALPESNMLSRTGTINEINKVKGIPLPMSEQTSRVSLVDQGEAEPEKLTKSGSKSSVRSINPLSKPSSVRNSAAKISSDRPPSRTVSRTSIRKSNTNLAKSGSKGSIMSVTKSKSKTDLSPEVAVEENQAQSIPQTTEGNLDSFGSMEIIRSTIGSDDSELPVQPTAEKAEIPSAGDSEEPKQSLKESESSTTDQVVGTLSQSKSNLNSSKTNLNSSKPNLKTSQSNLNGSKSSLRNNSTKSLSSKPSIKANTKKDTALTDGENNVIEIPQQDLAPEPAQASDESNSKLEAPKTPEISDSNSNSDLGHTKSKKKNVLDLNDNTIGRSKSKRSTLGTKPMRYIHESEAEEPSIPVVPRKSKLSESISNVGSETEAQSAPPDPSTIEV
ncbi:hypothetical protein HDV02_001995 [Globomyces sp. JEL0801]|nr:hypothetical protein HDV02_001995 [Globomyces sp. JEL0801]